MQRDTRLTLGAKARLVARIWLVYVKVRLTLWRNSLPRAVEILSTGRRPSHPPLDHLHMARIIDRTLRIRALRPRCLSRSLVLYHLVRQDSASVELVLGLPESLEGHQAHAWVEVGGIDIGPAPGGHGYEELARYP